MQNPSTIKQHANLVDRMAQANGVDLEEEILRGNFCIGELEDAVLSCTLCDSPGACSKWLTAHETQGTQADQPPGYCRNTELFQELSKGQP